MDKLPSLPIPREESKRSPLKDRLLTIGLLVELVLLGAVAGWYFFGRSETPVPQPIAVLGTRDVHALGISPSSVDTIFFGHHDGVLRSTDGGYRWQPLPISGDAMAVAIPPSMPQTVYMAGHEVFFKSTNGGNTWERMLYDLPYDDIHGLAIDTKDPNTLYAFVVGYGLFKSRDGGASWKKLSNGLPNTVMALAVAADNPQVLYAGTMSDGLLKSADGGVTFQRANKGIQNGMIMALATVPSKPGLIYAGTDKGLFRSNDGGANWSLTGFKDGVGALAVAPSNPELMLLVDMQTNVYRSNDAGATWGPGK